MTDESEDPAEDPLVGQVIQDRFRVEKKLGQGGMGAIYLAEHLHLKKQVAIKCLHAGIASNPEVVRRFKNEAVAASSIGHPNIIHVMDMGRFADGTFFMVLEFLDGRDWQHDLDEKGTESAAKVAHVGMQICAALEAAAAKGIVHRDLKPENIFLIERQGDKDFVKVLDFGISKILDGSGGATKTGALMGTPYYMAPEQVLGEKDITHLTDIYALGVIFFQALSGAVPFEGDTLAQVIMKIATQPPPSLAERAPTVPDGLVRLVDAMMLKDPDARPQTFMEVASRLSAFLGESSQLSSGARVAHASTVLGGQGPTSAHAYSANAVSSSSARAASNTDPARAEVSGKTPTWLIGMVAAAVLGLGVWFVSGASDEESSAGNESSESDSEDSDSVRVQISTVPANALLLLDGKSVPNPFDRELKKDEVNHELVIQRQGYATETRKMVLTAPQSIVVPLSKESEQQKEAGTGSSEGSTSGSRSNSTSGSRSGPAPQSQPGPAAKPFKELGRSIKSLF